MQGKVHVVIGVTTVACLCVKYPTGIELFGMNILPEIALVTAAAGSYAPDIDMGRTHAGQKHKVASKLISKFGGGHRGITHTLVVPLILGIIMFMMNQWLAPYPYICMIVQSLLFGFEAGWVMHIFADLFNGKGVPLLFPLSTSKIHVMDLPSSGFGGWMFAVIFVGIMAVITFGGFLG